MDNIELHSQRRDNQGLIRLLVGTITIEKRFGSLYMAVTCFKIIDNINHLFKEKSP